MLEVREASVFRKDLRRVLAQGKDYELFRRVLVHLIEQTPVPHKHHDHPLRQNWRGFRELHIQPDWLLIYKIDQGELFLARTGSHADLFG